MGVTKQAQSLCKDLTGTYRLAANAHSFLRLAVDFVLARIMRFVRVPLMNRERVVDLRDGTRLAYRLNRADLFTIHEIWINQDYRLPIELKPDLIIDLGANIGLAGLWLAKRYGCSQVVAMEPVAANASLARKNFRLNGISARVIEAAIGAEDGSVVFDRGPGATNGRVIAVPHDGQPVNGESRFAVSMVSMTSLLGSLPDDTPVGLIKMDIEGGEQDILSGDLSWLHRVDAMIAEFHPSLVDYRGLVKRLQDGGFQHMSSHAVESHGGNTLDFFRSMKTADDG